MHAKGGLLVAIVSDPQNWSVMMPAGKKASDGLPPSSQKTFRQVEGKFFLKKSLNTLYDRIKCIVSSINFTEQRWKEFMLELEFRIACTQQAISYVHKAQLSEVEVQQNLIEPLLEKMQF